MRRILHCQNCDMRLRISEAAAIVWNVKGTARVWCLKCWDADPKAVEQYRLHRSEFARKVIWLGGEGVVK